MTTFSPAQVAQQVLNQGGSKAQAWVAAALVDGIESNGDPTDKNPSSTACGLFQFLTTTWLSNGGGAYAPTACQANWEQQIQVFLNASAGSNFYPWAPDLGGSYNGNAKQPAATAPQPGSPVANKIAQLAAGGTLGAILGNVPSNWADAGAATPGGVGPTPGGGGSSSTGSGLGQCVIQFPGFLFLSGPCLLTKGGVKWLSGALAITAGGLLAAWGVIVLAAYGFDHSGAKHAATKAVGVLPTPIGRAAKATGSRSPQASSGRAGPVTSTAGRRESRDIERQYRETVRQQGPIGPRGGSATSERVAREQRRGMTQPGYGRPRTPEQRRAAQERASQPF